MKKELVDKARQIKFFLMDVDGVLTDGSLHYDGHGEEIKTFHIHDGYGIRRLAEKGITAGIISGRKSRAAELRAKELSVKEYHLGVEDKVKKYEEILKKYHLTDREVAYIGDDLPDLPLLKRVGFSLSVFNAIDEVKDQVDWVTKKSGGNGAVREAIDFILSALEGEKKDKAVGFLKQ